ncbi:MAG: hypothetical protein ACI4GO_09635 [Hominenteromicrobium sp.]
MMLNEDFERYVQPRDPEKISSDVEPTCDTVFNQGFSPVIYNSAAQEMPVRGRAVEYLPQDTMMLSVSECVMMLLVQLIPVLGLIMAAVWSFSPSSGINKRTVARAMLIVQCVVLAAAAAAWLIGLLR